MKRLKDGGARHPGTSLMELLSEYSLSKSEFARIIRVSRSSVVELIDQTRGITATMALRLQRAFGYPAEDWLHLQNAFDLHEARTGDKSAELASIQPLSAAKTKRNKRRRK